jgi:hypothetical protein
MTEVKRRYESLSQSSHARHQKGESLSQPHQKNLKAQKSPAIDKAMKKMQPQMPEKFAPIQENPAAFKYCFLLLCSLFRFRLILI